MKESTVSRDIRLAYGHGDVRLFRNNVGNLELLDGRRIQVGLCPGSSDLIGWESVRVTGDMIGSRIAVFTAIECKTPAHHTTPTRWTQQMNFINAVNKAGGYAGMAESVEQAALILRI
jgi:hypothetical protein